MSTYVVSPYVRDTEAEKKYTFAEIKWNKVIAIHKHWLPLDEFYKFFESNALFIDVTDLADEGKCPAIGSMVTNQLLYGKSNFNVQDVYEGEELKRYVIEKLKLTRDTKEQEPILYNESLFDADEISLSRMDKARKFLEDNDISSITWTTAQNTRVDIGVEDFKALNTLIAIRSNELHVRYNTLKQYILDLDDKYEPILIYIHWNWNIEQDLDAFMGTINDEQNNP